MSKSGKAGAPRPRTPGFTEGMKALASSALAQKAGYLHVGDFPDARFFSQDNLPIQAYALHKLIRCKKDELLLVTRGMVEVWHTHHDLLVKKLMAGTLFGEMPLLGQTMVITQAVAGDTGATLAVLDVGQVRELIKANALALAEKLYPRLASVEAEHYRAIFQPAQSRLAALLLELAGEGTTVEGLTQRQLGERIGLVRETVLMAMASLKAKKLIGVNRRKTVLFDKKALEALSRP
jgi:CRP-like cAMP-binding protein